MLLKYRIGAKFWKLSTTCVNLWLALAYRLPARRALWLLQAWRISTRFNASSFFNNFKIFQNVGWHAAAVAWKLLCHPSMQFVVLGSSSYVLWNIFLKLIEKKWSSLRSILFEPTNKFVPEKVEKVVIVLVEDVPQITCKFLKVCYNVAWWSERKRWYHTQGVDKILPTSFLQSNLFNSFPEIFRKVIETTLHFSTRQVCSSSANRN